MTDSARAEPDQTKIAADSASARNRIKCSQIVNCTDQVCKVGAMRFVGI